MLLFQQFLILFSEILPSVTVLLHMHSFPCVLRNSLPHSCVLLPVFMSVHYSVPDPSFLLSLLSFDSPFHHVLLVWLFPSSLPAVSIHSSCLVFLPSVDARTDMHISNIQPLPWETILSLSNPFFLIENQSSLSSLLFLLPVWHQTGKTVLLL